jgi:hypothetical protein
VIFRTISGRRHDLRRVRNADALTNLELELATLCSWEGVERFSALTSLVILRSDVPDLSALERLPALTTLWVSESRVPSLAPISALGGLRRLVLGIAETDLERFDLAALAALDQLRVLQLNICGTSRRALPLDLSFLRGMPHLEELSLTGRYCHDEAPLLSLPDSLRSLQFLARNKDQVDRVRARHPSVELRPMVLSAHHGDPADQGRVRQERTRGGGTHYRLFLTPEQCFGEETADDGVAALRRFLQRDAPGLLSELSIDAEEEITVVADRPAPLEALLEILPPGWPRRASQG